MSSRDWHADGEQLQDDLAAYALGALAAPESAAIERHLDGCDSCRERVQWLRPAVDLLPASVEQRTPPESLRENLLEIVRAEAAPGPERARGREPWWRGLGSVMLRPATALAVLAVLAVGVAAGYVVRGGDEETASTFVGAKGLGAQAAQVSATLERHDQSATLHVSELPPLDRDEVYEVWVQRAGTMEPASTFILGPDGGAEAPVPGPLEGAEAVFVTKEPRPGTSQPTSEPLLEAPLR